DNVALVQIEELSLFPFRHLAYVLSQYKEAREFVWVQEEPRNQGAWSHVSEQLNTVLQHIGCLDRILGAQLCKGAAAILNKNPGSIIVPKTDRSP
ncbi:hypothetical protein C8Q72DRAFT_781363, partial [Fomitopsis betulina]